MMDIRPVVRFERWMIGLRRAGADTVCLAYRFEGDGVRYLSKSGVMKFEEDECGEVIPVMDRPMVAAEEPVFHLCGEWSRKAGVLCGHAAFQSDVKAFRRAEGRTGEPVFAGDDEALRFQALRFFLPLASPARWQMTQLMQWRSGTELLQLSPFAERVRDALGSLDNSEPGSVSPRVRPLLYRFHMKALARLTLSRVPTWPPCMAQTIAEQLRPLCYAFGLSPSRFIVQGDEAQIMSVNPESGNSVEIEEYRWDFLNTEKGTFSKEERRRRSMRHVV